MTPTVVDIDGYSYEFGAQGPPDARWDTPREYAGQIIEWSFAEPGKAGAQGPGAMFARKIDHSLPAHEGLGNRWYARRVVAPIGD